MPWSSVASTTAATAKPLPPGFTLPIPVRQIPDDLRAKLDASITYNVLRQGERSVTKAERKVISKRIGESFAEDLLAPLRPWYEVTDMNRIRENYPGYDFLVHRKGTVASVDPTRNQGLRIQVKGNTAPEWVGFDHSSGECAGIAYDVVLLVDAGPNTTARPCNPRGRSPKADLTGMPVLDHIELYAIPVEEVRKRILMPEQAHWNRKWVSWWKVPVTAASEICADWPGIVEWKGRVDVILDRLHLAD